MKIGSELKEKTGSDIGIIDVGNDDLDKEVFWFRTNNETVWFSLNDIKKLKTLVEVEEL